MNRTICAIVGGVLIAATGLSQAHHVLGRPSYGLSEDRNTPPSMEMETQIGEYFVTFMVFPATPEPNEPGRVHLFASRIADDEPLRNQVTFEVRDDSWFSSNVETLGVQQPVDHVYRQGFEFSEEGEYIITARFQAGGEPYRIDFPLRIGSPAPIGPIGTTVAVILFVLVGVNLLQRKRLQRLQTSRRRAEEA